mmetsp:Transcript_105698/g.297292  ORF Transcript_105698/g.297292 Transcript_105698/m.297292 type:complete len:331 (-) Transcript_105698:171-1163(-)
MPTPPPARNQARQVQPLARMRTSSPLTDRRLQYEQEHRAMLSAQDHGGHLATAHRPTSSRSGRLQRLTGTWVQKARRVLSGGCGPHVQDGDDVASDLARCLYLAADGGHHARAEALLRRGAPTDHVTRGGWTPLMRAAFHGDLEMLQLLLKAGATPDQGGANQQTALDLCVMHGHVELLAPLLLAKADPAARDYSAVRQALLVRSDGALAVFGVEVLGDMYARDRRWVGTLEQQLGLAGVARARGLDQHRGQHVPDDAREKARLQTLSGTTNDPQCEEVDFTCVVCLRTPRSVLLQPCMHLALCGECAPQVKSCPVCRKDISQRVKVFLS